MNAIFTYAPQLAEQIASRWSEFAYRVVMISPSLRETCRLPSQAILSHICELAYQISLTTEEARSVRPKLIWCERTRLSELQETPDIVCAPIVPCRVATVSELNRLAPATNPRHTAIVLASEGASDQVDIWGLVHFGSSWAQFRAGELPPNQMPQMPPAYLTFDVRGPGHIGVSFAGRALCILRGGEIRFHPVNILSEASSPLADWFATARFRHVDQARDAGHKTALDFDFILRDAYDAYLMRLLKGAAERRHGGAFIFVRDTTHDETQLPQLRVKYPLKVDVVWKALIDAFSDQGGERRSAIWRLNDAADLVINLSSVDGAVVLTDTFRVIGFGTEILIDEGPRSVSVFDGGRGTAKGDIPIDGFGTRHRSAFRLCTVMQDAVVFVVSQDGDVRGVMALAQGGVGLWPDVALGHRAG